MKGYDVFARLYDTVMGDRAEHAKYLHGLIEKHHPEARTLLELACGTGSVLKQLQPHYEVAGSDLSGKMLELAAQKVPQARLFQADMSRVSLGQSFDVVLCVYDSINHLLKFEQWEATFDRALEHLDDGGVFIFDVNTERKLSSFVGERAWSQWFGDDLVVIDVRDGGGGIAVWTIRIFEQLENSEYRLTSADIPEVAFPIDRIRTSLDERFARVWAYDAARSRPTSRSERIHFVCRR
jgi:SAM-dependent methyltransferase